ncbi:hypothetical protein [Acinetobacter silvestris]|uniref:Phage abortive infection protein n=1 Tax=Acinetobacter silvestris TaxID=1977882 RepID=A0A1Y3CJW1_9GAMM|nr:hypothetical protein [Acinetobacter silvestris]OTG65906.1 hypothetical protein B9T28_06820 [Acinetobacter silvestris]
MEFSFENKRQVSLLIVLVALVWLFFPFLFKAFMFWMDWIGVDLKTFAAYGPISDIYGSLNTLFTSATLILVIYSTILQRKANAEMRQFSVDQINASRHATFTNMFHSLLNYKSERFNQISMSTKDKTLDACEISNLIAEEFQRLVQNKWKNIDKIEKEELKNSFEYCIAKITKGKGYYKIHNYFFIYESIFNLIENEKLSLKDQDYFKDLVRNSMEVGEQITILWIASFSDYSQKFLMNSGIFSFELADDHIPFINKFLSTTLFFNKDFVNKINDYSKNQNPT